jgi:hypothetical protein
VGFDVLTTCQPSTVWCSRERLPAAADQPAQGSSDTVAPRILLSFLESKLKLDNFAVYEIQQNVKNFTHHTLKPKNVSTLA